MSGSSAPPSHGCRRGRIPAAGEPNVDLARRGLQAALRGDLDAVGELLDPEVRWHAGDPSAPWACHDRGEALAFMRRSDAILSGRVELVDAIAAGDKVVVIIERP